MKKIWIHKAKSFKEAEEFDRAYYAKMTPQERVNTVIWLRETHLTKILTKGRKYTNAGRLRRVVKVIQQKKG